MAGYAVIGSVVDLLIKNIRGLVQVRPGLSRPLSGAQMAELPVLQNAFLAIHEGRIAGFGRMDELSVESAGTVIDASDRFVLPTFVDSHTHLIFPASREEEFVMKIKGASYAEIAAKGGGILNSARTLARTSEEELYTSALARLNEIASSGTGAVEIKSGYGLSTEGELKMLRVAKKLREAIPLAIRTTFLGAHAVPQGRKKSDYIDEVITTMIPAVAAEGLAEYIDVFCENGFFSQQETERILMAGREHGLKGRVHANQLGRTGGVQAAVNTGSISADHLENIGDDEIEALATSDVIATALPGAAFFLNLPMPPARRLIEAGIPLAVATDYNPGSAPSGNMMMMLAFACIRMRLTPEEAVNATTINGAFALELQDDFGSITEGKIGSVFITKPVSSLAYLPYAFGSALIETVILKGKVFAA